MKYKKLNLDEFAKTLPCESFTKFSKLMDSNLGTRKEKEQAQFFASNKAAWQYNQDQKVYEIPFGRWTVNPRFMFDEADVLNNTKEHLDCINPRRKTALIKTETYQTTFTSYQYDKKLWLNSPVCFINFNYDIVFQGLKKSRRDKIKIARRDLGNYTVVFNYHITDNELSFCIERLKTKWIEEDLTAFALAQFFWAMSQNKTLWVKVLDNNTLVGLACFIIERKDNSDFNEYKFQGIACHPINGIGIFMLDATARYISNIETTAVLNPTCKYMLEENSVDTYKRVIVNTDVLNPMLYINKGAMPKHITPPYYNEGWSKSTDLVIKGEGV